MKRNKVEAGKGEVEGARNYGKSTLNDDDDD